MGGAGMNVTIGNCIIIENPTEDIKFYCREHLELTNPEYIKKQRMGLWTGNVPKKLTLYEINGNSIQVPFGCLSRISPMLSAYGLVLDFKDPVSVDYGEDISLYPYQQNAVEQAFMGRFGILQSPAGSGKTQMGIELIKMYGRKTLWLTHTKDLLTQSKERAEKYIDSDLIGTITEGKVNIGKGVTFATVQTMCKLDLPRYRDEWDLIIVDECHRCAGTATSVTQFSKVLMNLAARHKYGLSATVHRSDGLIESCYALLGDIVAKVDDSAVSERVMRVNVLPVGTGTRMSMMCLNTDGTINYSKLVNFIADNPDRNQTIVNEIVENSGHPSLILSDRLEHLETLMEMLPADMRKDACMVSGKMSSKSEKQLREQYIEQMRSGEKKYLFASYNLAKEGLDIPCLDRLYLTTPHKDYAVITQCIGRIARVCDGKDNPVCIDFVDSNIEYLNRAFKKRCTVYRKNKVNFI